jgi:actin-related protein 9
MFNAEKEGEFEPVKIRRRDETDSTHNGHDHTGANGEADENDGWEEDHISEEGAVWPMKHGRIVDWPAFYALMTHVYNTVNPPFHTPVLLISEPVWTPKDLEKVTQFFFERFKVPAFAVMDAAMAATYAYGVPTATVVDVGLEKADITCVSDYVLQHIGRSLAVPDCGGEALTDRLMEVMKGRKGFGRDFCDQLKRSGICEILPSDAEILRPGAGADDGATNPAAVASTGIDGGSGQKVAGSGAAGDALDLEQRLASRNWKMRTVCSTLPVLSQVATCKNTLHRKSERKQRRLPLNTRRAAMLNQQQRPNLFVNSPIQDDCAIRSCTTISIYTTL